MRVIRAFTLIELIVVIFILTLVYFFTIPSFFKDNFIKDEVELISHLRVLREDSITSKREGYLTIDFKDRFFSFKSSSGQKKISMKEDERWEVYIPSRGNIKDGQVTVVFPPFPSIDFIVFYLDKESKNYTIFLNNITGEVELFKEKKSFYD